MTIPSFEYTTKPGEAWWPSTEVAQGVAQYCNWYWRERKEQYVADTLSNETGIQAMIRVTDKNGLTAFIRHPIRDFDADKEGS